MSTCLIAAAAQTAAVETEGPPRDRQSNGIKIVNSQLSIGRTLGILYARTGRKDFAVTVANH